MPKSMQSSNGFNQRTSPSVILFAFINPHAPHSRAPARLQHVHARARTRITSWDVWNAWFYLRRGWSKFCSRLSGLSMVRALYLTTRSLRSTNIGSELERSCSDAGVSLPHRTIIDSSTNRLLLLQRDVLFPQHPNVSLSWLD